MLKLQIRQLVLEQAGSAESKRIQRMQLEVQQLDEELGSDDSDSRGAYQRSTVYGRSAAAERDELAKEDNCAGRDYMASALVRSVSLCKYVPDGVDCM